MDSNIKFHYIKINQKTVKVYIPILYYSLPDEVLSQGPRDLWSWTSMLGEGCKQSLPLYIPRLINGVSGPGPDKLIITDSLEIAEANQIHLHDKCKSEAGEIEWISWYGGIEGIARTDWSYVWGKNVYILMVEHSGYERDEIYRRAESLQKKLREFHSNSVKFISYLDDHVVKAQVLLSY